MLGTAEQYAKRKTLYKPGDIVTIPTFTAFGGDDDRAGVGVVASCNWLGLVQLYLVDRWVNEGEAVGPVDPSEPVEAWWGGDGLLISEIFEVVGSVDGYAVDDWPAAIDKLPLGETEGRWFTHFKTRKKMPITEPLDPTSTRQMVTHFKAVTLDYIPVRVSERLNWATTGFAPDAQPDPVSGSRENQPQSWIP